MEVRKTKNICGALILILCCISTIDAQSAFFTIPIGLSENPSQIIEDQTFELRLDLITESQIEELLSSKSISFDQICDIVMGCNTRDGEIILDIHESIRLFDDARVIRTKLIKKELSGKFTILSDTDNAQNELILKTPESITKSNIMNYSIVFERVQRLNR